jgi:uncharacterized protein
MPTAQEVIKQLNLAPHPENGWYSETFRDSAKAGADRSASTAIYYLLERGQVSRWHRVLDAAEIWHFYGGSPLQLSLSHDDGQPLRHRVLGPDVLNNQAPQIVVAESEWQRAQSLGDWTLVGTTVAPGFTFDVFEMAPPDWEPNATSQPK